MKKLVLFAAFAAMVALSACKGEAKQEEATAAPVEEVLPAEEATSVAEEITPAEEAEVPAEGTEVVAE